MKPKIEIYKIFYNEETRALIEPPYLPLDNSSTKNDWFELGPMLSFLETHQLEDDVWYGFVSPKFPEKAHLTFADVEQTIQKAPPGTEVALFSYNWPLLAIHKNTFLAGEIYHPGLCQSAQDFLDAIAFPLNVREGVSDFETSVYSNYIVAKKRFWDAWKTLARQYVDYCDAGGPALLDNQDTQHVGKEGYRLKTFVQERLVNCILASGDFSTTHPDYEKLPIIATYRGSSPRAVRKNLLKCDQLKAAYRKSGNPIYLWRYLALRRYLLTSDSIFQRIVRKSARIMQQALGRPQ